MARIDGRFMRCAVVAACALAFFVGSARHAIAGDLLTAAIGEVPPGAPSQRARLARVDLAEVPEWTVAAGRTVVFNLWDGVTLTGSVDSATPTDAGRILSGALADEPGSSFIAVVRDEVLVAEVRSPTRGAWCINPVGAGLHAVRQIDWNEFKTCATGSLAPVVPPAALPDAGAAGFSPRDVPTVTVMIVYTAQARAGAGGQDGIDAVIDLAITQANQTYVNSQINAKLKLVYRGLVDYVESGSASTDIYALQDPTDGVMDEVHALRDCHGADIVTLFVNNFNACGIGFLMSGGPYQGFSSFAFNVVDKDCIPNFSFAHEVGHNLGCHHDRGNAGGGFGAYSYSFGYRTPDQLYRTVMAYAPGERVGYFSNPAVTYLGYVMGVPVGQTGETNNALTISQTAPTAATFRADACRSDVDQNCFVNGDDFDLFYEWFYYGDPDADYDGNTFVNGDDFDAFAQDFWVGC